jgi:hypothetical protein
MLRKKLFIEFVFHDMRPSSNYALSWRINISHANLNRGFKSIALHMRQQERSGSVQIG